MGTKRSWEGQPLELHPKDTIMAEAESSVPPVLSIFENFRDELDEHHDRRERIIKKSRDITALSKKMYASTSIEVIYDTLTDLLTASSPSSEFAQRINPSHPKSPKKIKPALTKSTSFLRPSSLNNSVSTAGGISAKSAPESRNSSKRSPSTTTCARRR